MNENKKSDVIYRQGDVCIRKVAKLPDGLKKKDSILAYGEVSGHKHRLTGSAHQVFVNPKQEQFIQVSEKTELVHEEHGTIELEEGSYAVILQEEYTPQGMKRVQD